MENAAVTGPHGALGGVNGQATHGDHIAAREPRPHGISVGGKTADGTHGQCAMALAISSVIFLASPSTMTVLSR